MNEPNFLLLCLTLARALAPGTLRLVREGLSTLGRRIRIRRLPLTPDRPPAADNDVTRTRDKDSLFCLFLNYSPINTVFDWSYAADGAIGCVFVGTLLFNGNQIGLIVKKMARSRVTSRQGVTQFRTSRLARFDRLREDQFSCLFELRCMSQVARPRLLLRGVANLHHPDSHFIFVLDADKLTPLNLLFYPNSVVPDYDPFEDIILMPQKLLQVPAFALVSLNSVTFHEVARVEFHPAGMPAPEEEALADRFFSVQVKVGRIFDIALVSLYVPDHGSMDYQLKVYERCSRQLVCQTSFFESGFSFYRFLVEDDYIMFFSLMSHLKRYRIVVEPGTNDDVIAARPRRVELRATQELRSCVGSRSPSMWPHKDCRHGNFVMELFAWTLQREEFNLRGILCCSLAAYERGIAADPSVLAHMLAVCAEDSGDNVVAACRLPA